MNYLQFLNKFNILTFSGLCLGLCMFSYGQSSSEAPKTETTPPSKTAKVALKSFKIGVQVGYGYRIAPIPDTNDPFMKNHLEKLKHNLSLGADFSYYFTNFIGIGVKYNTIVSYALTENISYSFADGVRTYDYLSELRDIHYFAPFFATQLFTMPRKQCLFTNAGVGYVLDRHNAILVKNEAIKEIANIAKHSAAFFVEIGYDFFVSRFLAIGLQTSLLVELKKGKWSEPENLSYIDISLGFRFYK